MPFAHLAGVTTPGAPDEVIDWFATFEAWMTGVVGWTVAAGAGTQDIYFESVSEAGGLTMLFVHVWRDLVNVNRVHLEVTDDAVPTHSTNEGGYVDSGGVQFAYWMTADMDALVVVFKLGAAYRVVYAGMVMPFALTIPDETYCMIATSTVTMGSILRDFNNVWDVDHNLYESDSFDFNAIDPLSAEFTLAGTYFNFGANIAGQLRHVSCMISSGAISAEDTIETGRAGATTTWIVLSDHNNVRFAMRTGGILPTGIVDGTFVSALGVAANSAALFAAITAFAVNVGWTDLGSAGVIGGSDISRLYFSTGESGLEVIYVAFSHNWGAGTFRLHTADDAVMTHLTGMGGSLNLFPHEFPINYWLCGDLDCIVLTFQRAVGYSLAWAGLVSSFSGAFVAPPQQSVNSLVSWPYGQGATNPELLYGRNAAWQVAIQRGFDGAVQVNNSSPNAFDGVTYLVWPWYAMQVVGGWGDVPVGQFKYVGVANGGGIANMDTITVAGQVYTVFFTMTGLNFCVRTT